MGKSAASTRQRCPVRVRVGVRLARWAKRESRLPFKQDTLRVRGPPALPFRCRPTGRAPKGVLGNWLAQRPVKPSRRESPWGFESLRTHLALVAQRTEHQVPNLTVASSSLAEGTHGRMSE